MKKARRGALSIISRALVILLVIALLPFAKDLYRLIMPDVTGEIAVQSRILQQKLESSQRMEVTRIEEEGVLEAKTNVIIFGTVGATTIRYRYTASFGIDLKKVKMTAESDRITFVLPDIEVLNDGIEALEINRNNLFSKAIEKSVETLLNEHPPRPFLQFNLVFSDGAGAYTYKLDGKPVSTSPLQNVRDGQKLEVTFTSNSSYSIVRNGAIAEAATAVLTWFGGKDSITTSIKVTSDLNGSTIDRKTFGIEVEKAR